MDASSNTFAPDLPETVAGEELTLSCNFTPLVLSTMSKYSDESQFTVSITLYNQEIIKIEKHYFYGSINSKCTHAGVICECMIPQRKPAHHEIAEVKPYSAGLELGWVTVKKYLVLNAVFFPYLSVTLQIHPLSIILTVSLFLLAN